MRKTLQILANNQVGMSLSSVIALAFAGAVVAVFIVGSIVYLVKA